MKKRRVNLYHGVVFLFAIVGLLASYGCAPGRVALKKEVEYRTLSLEEYEDKVAGGWLGQAIGVLWGEDTEGKWQGEIVPFDLDEWYRIKMELKSEVWAAMQTEGWSAWAKLGEYARDWDNWETYTPEQMSNQDDLYIEFLFLHSIQKYGLDVTGKQMAEDWVSYLDSNLIWVANKAAYQNFVKGIWPPESGHPDNTPHGNAIDFQIESDLFGLISPGLPQVSNAWGDKVGHIMNYGDGVYAGMAMAAMYGEAFFESDPRKLVELSLQAIPEESGYAQMVRDVIAAHDKHPDDWQSAWAEIEPKWGPGGAVDVRINGAYVYMGLLYGEGDFWKTMNISMRCGRDSDCNPSSSAGIVGTVLGMSGIPEKWAILRDKPVSNANWTGGQTLSEIYPNPINWDDILAATVEVGKQNILANGGKIKDGMIYIPMQTPTVPPLEQVPMPEAQETE